MSEILFQQNPNVMMHLHLCFSWDQKPQPFSFHTYNILLHLARERSSRRLVIMHFVYTSLYHGPNPPNLFFAHFMYKCTKKFSVGSTQHPKHKNAYRIKEWGHTRYFCNLVEKHVYAENTSAKHRPLCLFQNMCFFHASQLFRPRWWRTLIIMVHTLVLNDCNAFTCFFVVV